jgi:8-amino-7-oxononanoate synthase
MPVDPLSGTFFGPSNLVDLLEHRCRHQPNDIAFTFLVDGETTQVDMTYRDLADRARAIAAQLASMKLTDQRALLLYPPGLDFVAAFFGCLYARVVAVPVYPPRPNRSLARIEVIAADTDARVALTTESVLQRVHTLVEQTPRLRDLNWLATCQIPEALGQQWKMPAVRGETLAFLQYTSGSTGAPKGVMLSHGNLMHNSALIAHAFEHTRSGMGVFWLPSYHDMGLIGGILQPVFVGRPNVLMSPMSFLQKPYRWLAAITRFSRTNPGGITSGGPNFAYELCVRKITPEQRATLDLSRWTVAFNGAEPIRAETLDHFVEAFGPCGFRREAFYPCYGLAEATLIVSGGYAWAPPKILAVEPEILTAGHASPPDAAGPNGRYLVGCGGVLPDERVVIVDPETLTRCGAGEVGEIWVNSPSVAQGYWQQSDATKNTFGARLQEPDEGPFLRTGDLGFLSDGELFVTGRLKDMIIVRGVNHYPHDIEFTVEQSYPDLRPGCGAAFAVERPGGEELVIVQEIERGTHGDLPAIFAAIHRAVTEEHDVQPAALVLVKAGAIPKTSSGKIRRLACRDAYLDGSLSIIGQWKTGDPLPTLAARTESTASEGLSHLLAPANGKHSPWTERTEPATVGNGRAMEAIATQEVEQCILEEVRRVAKQRAEGLTLDTPIVGLGMDSLERMEIVAAIEERFGGRFPEDILPQLETCRQLVEAVRRHLGSQQRLVTVIAADAEIPHEYYQVEQFPEMLRLEQIIDSAQAVGMQNPFFHVHEGVLSSHTRMGGRDLINYASFDYVGMSGDPAVMAAAKAAIDRYGTSASASRLVSGERVLHRELDATIASFLGTEDAITFVSGHSTNESVIGHLIGPGDMVLYDELSHNSIVQGAHLSGARRRTFHHNDWQMADALLREFRRNYRRVLMVIEGVYSMDGDVPDLPQFIAIKNRHKAMLMIDEAHSLGTLGAHGRGIGEQFNVDRKDVDIWMGSMAKGMGSCGGYIAGSKALVKYLRYTTPSFVYAAGLAPAAAAAALTSLRVLQAEPERVTRLQKRAELLLALAKQRGLNTGGSFGTPVVPVILGNSLHCLAASQAMLERGVNVRPILHPAVEENATRLRFFVNTNHTEAEIRYTIDALMEVLAKIDSRFAGNTCAATT